MEFLATEFILQKKRGARLRQADIENFVAGYVAGEIPDYQMAAWLMAACFQPLNTEETAWLTAAMASSGRRLHFPNSVDKHSTGGIGDKTSLIVAPLVAAAGVLVPMMAGRGLAHTGGTLDKLEAIHGMNVRLDIDAFEKQVRRLGVAITGQTDEICPADRKMYALRDVTGTVDSRPLICASIMSKKIAEGCQALVLDVKFGSGAFMKTLAQAEELANALAGIGRAAGLRVTALLTNMNEPLGRFVGNALEVQECLEILRREKISRPGKDIGDTETLSLELAAQMLLTAGRCQSVAEANQLVRTLLENGKAYEKFEEMIAAQNGDPLRPLAKASESKVLQAERDGYLRFTDCEKLGLGCVVLGAGRRRSSDPIDPSAGAEVLIEDGQKVKKGEPIFALHASGSARLLEAEGFFRASYSITEESHGRFPLIAKILGEPMVSAVKAAG